MSDECIMIESSDDDEVQVMEPPINILPGEENLVKRRVELQPAISGKNAFIKFLIKCKEVDSSSDMDTIVNKMWKRFNEADQLYTTSSSFINIINKLMDGISSEPYTQLKSLSDELKYHTINTKKQHLTSTPIDENRISLKRQLQIRKLEQIVEKLNVKITRLEVEEVDSSDDENSSYIQVSRYKDRICQVFRKICELRNMSQLESPLRNNIKFSGTKLPEVNRAIEKFYNERREFPDFCDVLKVVQKINSSKSLNLSSGECQIIAEKGFKELGETLKKQRQYEFHDTINCYLPDDTKDPAEENADLLQILETNKREYGNRIDEIIDKYALKQVEENLLPVDVPSDVPVESEVDEESTDNDVSDDIISVSEHEIDNGSEENNSETNEEVPQSRDFKIVLTNVMHLPEWKMFQPQKNDNFVELISHQCEPVPGCSKNISDNFCEKCTCLENENGILNRKRTSSTLESTSWKKTKVGENIFVNTEEEETTKNKIEKFIQPKILSVSSISPEITNKSLSLHSNNECETEKTFSNVSLEVNLSTIDSNFTNENEKTPEQEISEKIKHINNEKPVGNDNVNEIDKLSTSAFQYKQNIIHIDEVSGENSGIEKEMDVVESKEISNIERNQCTEKSLQTIEDNNEDEVMIIDETNINENSSKIMNMAKSEEVMNVTNSKESWKCHEETIAEKDKQEVIDIEQIVKKTEKPEEIIDVERLSDETVKLNGVITTNLSQIIRNMNLPFDYNSSSTDSLVPVRDNNRTPHVPSTRFRRENSRNYPSNNFTFKPRYPFTSTPKSFYSHKNNTSAYTRYSPNSVGISNQRHRLFNQNQVNPLNRRSTEMQRTFHSTLSNNRNMRQRLPFSQTAMQKRTTQTTDYKLVKNNILTKTTTIVEESVMRVDSSNSQSIRFQMGQNSRSFHMQGHYTAQKRTQHVQKFRADAKNSSSDDIITLD